MSNQPVPCLLAIKRKKSVSFLPGLESYRLENCGARRAALRPAEVFGIIKSDIQDDGLHITGDIGLISDNVRGRTPTKTETSRRTIPLTDKCREIFDTAAALSTNELVFQTYKGKAFNTSKVGEYIGNISKELGIDFRAYDLRHQFATDLTSYSYGIDGTF